MRVTIANTTEVDLIRLRDVSFFDVIPETSDYVSGTELSTSFFDSSSAHDVFELTMTDTTADNQFVITNIEFKDSECI